MEEPVDGLSVDGEVFEAGEGFSEVGAEVLGVFDGGCFVACGVVGFCGGECGAPVLVHPFIVGAGGGGEVIFGAETNEFVACDIGGAFGGEFEGGWSGRAGNCYRRRRGFGRRG